MLHFGQAGQRSRLLPRLLVGAAGKCHVLSVWDATLMVVVGDLQWNSAGRRRRGAAVHCTPTQHQSSTAAKAGTAELLSACGIGDQLAMQHTQDYRQLTSSQHLRHEFWETYIGSWSNRQRAALRSLRRHVFTQSNPITVVK